MHRRLWLSVAMVALGAGLLVAAGFASPASSAPKSGSGGAAKQGGTLRVNLQSDVDYVDPALAYYQPSWNLEYATCLKLLNYADKPGAAGSRLIPEAAQGFPKVSSDGKTYTFTVKKGFRFNTGATVTAANFAYAINRDLTKEMQSPAASFISDIAGSQAVLDGKAKSASGVIAKGNTLTIKLTKVAPDFLARIAMPFFCAIPTNLPIDSKGVQTLPSAGPYYVAAYTPNRSITLKKNTNYKGPRAGNVSQVVYNVGVSLDATLLQVKQDQSDWAGDGVPPTAHADLAKTYGINKPNGQYHVNSVLAFRYLALNTARPLFADANVRQAVNYAIDRPAILRQRGAFAGKRTSHYLPPGIPGSKNQQPYPLNGATPANVNKAKKLMGGKTGDAVLYTCNAGACPPSAQIIQFNLKQIGINVDVKQFARGVQFEKEGTKGEPFDIGFEGWLADYADPFDFINILLDGRTIGPTNNVNFAYFNSAKYNNLMEQASRLSGQPRYNRYGELDQDIAKNAAPLAAWDNDNQRDFVSKSFGGFLYQPIYGPDLTTAFKK